MGGGTGPSTPSKQLAAQEINNNASKAAPSNLPRGTPQGSPSNLPTETPPMEAAATHDGNTTGTPKNWKENVLHNLDEKATKADNAMIPIQFWDNALAKDLGKQILSQGEKKAVDTIQKFVVDKIWKRSVVKCFVFYLRCKSCHHNRSQQLFNDGKKIELCASCKKYEQAASTKPCVKVAEGGYCWKRVIGKTTTTKYEWTKDGRKQYKKLFCILRKFGKPKMKEEASKDVGAARDCIARVVAASMWKWEGGSWLFFWR